MANAKFPFPFRTTVSCGFTCLKAKKYSGHFVTAGGHSFQPCSKTHSANRAYTKSRRKRIQPKPKPKRAAREPNRNQAETEPTANQTETQRNRTEPKPNRNQTETEPNRNRTEPKPNLYGAESDPIGLVLPTHSFLCIE